MTRRVVGSFFVGATLLTLAAPAAEVEELTVHFVVAAQRSGPSADNIITMINSSENAIATKIGPFELSVKDKGTVNIRYQRKVVRVAWQS